jgi:hypothetical protein
MPKKPTEAEAQETQVIDLPVQEDVAVQPATGNGLVVPAGTGQAVAVAVSVADRRRAAAGVGVSQNVRDRYLPFIGLLQKTSPQIERGSDSYVEGAEFGDIILKNFPFPNPIVKGDAGFLFQLAASRHNWVEWRPKRAGGGIVRQIPMTYDSTGAPVPPNGARIGPHPDIRNKEALLSPEGHILVDTRYLAGNFVSDANDPLTAIPCMISLTSTGHRFFRQINTVLSQLVMDGRRVSAMDRLFHLTTQRREKDGNSWVEWKFADHGPTSDDLWELGFKLYEQFSSGEKVVDTEAVSEAVQGEVIDHETGEILPRGRAAGGAVDASIPFAPDRH